MAATASKTIKCEIVTPEKVVFTGEVEMLVATTTMGEVGILPLHIPLVTELCVGELRIKQNNNWIRMFIGRGFLKFSLDIATVLVSEAEFATDIDVVESKQEADRLAKAIEEKTDGIDFDKLQEEYQAALAKIRVASKK
ncbi:MAG: ATP synthase F1 subunit epsilon [Actinobacteria bacterium]|nr:MAG: ATP synthase F1 subunit epsilon [Actinomycetota bacterium]